MLALLKSVAAGAWVHLEAIDLCQRLSRARAPEGQSLRLQGFQRRLVQGVSLALVNDVPVPLQTKPLQGSQDVVRGAFHLSGRIQILHPNQPLPLMGLGVQPAGHGCDHGPQVQASSG